MMLGGSDWGEQLKQLREREFLEIFGDCPAGTFGRVLELGAGNGFQSRLLAEISDEVVATDYAYREKVPPPADGVEFRFADAETVGTQFPPNSFDLVFSSNLLEHLPAPENTLVGARHLLTDGGLMIHVVPSVWWKMSYMALYYPFQATRVLRRVRRTGGTRTGSKRGRAAGAKRSEQEDAWVAENNPKVDREQRPRWLQELLPSPHGASQSNVHELLDFRQRRWLRLFEQCHVTVAGTVAGPLSSGLGFGFERLRRLLERLGIAGEYAYVAHRPGDEPKALKLILGDGHSGGAETARHSSPDGMTRRRAPR